MRNGDATIADVAAAAGVSRAAVSKVLRNAYGVSDAMRTKVQNTIDELGYRPRIAARTMRGAGYILGVEIPNLANPFIDRVMTGMTSSLVDTPYRVVIAPAGGDQDNTKAIESLADLQVDGLLAIGARAATPWLEEQGRHRPLVVVGRHEESVTNFDTIVDDDTLGTRLALNHLHALGHRRITHLTDTSTTHPQMGCSSHTVRSRAYTKIMAELGLAENSRTELVAPTEEAAHQRTAELLDEADPPTAIYAGHDELALGVLRAIAERGLDASDVSVVGYDDTTIASHPLISLTTISQSGNVIGSLAARLLLERIAGRTEAMHTVIMPELRARRSSASPRYLR
ncbi:LacI family DNA-binding transcriptional regulator [Tessaracoccus sp.]